MKSWEGSRTREAVGLVKRPLLHTFEPDGGGRLRSAFIEEGRVKLSICQPVQHLTDTQYAGG